MKACLRRFGIGAAVLIALLGISKPSWVLASVEQFSELIQNRRMSLNSKFERPHQIHGAVALHLSERGQSYFKNDLSDAIYRVSQAFTPKAIDPTTGRSKDLEMKYAEPLDMKTLSPKVSLPFENLKTEIHTWLNDKFLEGVKLNTPQPDFNLKKLEYQVEYSKLSVKFLDPNDNNSPQDTFRILFEVEVPYFQVVMSDLTLVDLQNDFLGTFGSKTPEIGFNSQLQNSEPFRISAQVTIQNVETGLNAKITEVSTNLETVNLNLGFKPLILPAMSVSINGHKYPLNQTTLNKYLDDNIPSLLKSFQHFAVEYVQNELLTKANQALIDSLGKGIGSMDLMPPPGGPDLLPQTDFLQYGLSLYSSEKIGSRITINMMGYAEDPLAPSLNSEMAKDPVHVYPARLTSFAEDQYDLALSLNENFLNQLLFLSFKRGYFDDIPLGDKGATHLKLASTPVIHFHDGEARLSLHVATQMHGIATLAVQKEVEAKFDVLLGIEKDNRGGFRVLITGTDIKSGAIDPQYIKSMKRLVKKIFSNYLKTADKSFKKQPKILAEHIPVPSELFGIPLVLEAGYPENTGNFVIYLSLDRNQIEQDKLDRSSQ